MVMESLMRSPISIRKVSIVPDAIVIDLSQLSKITAALTPAQIPTLLNAVVLVAGIDARSLAVPQVPVSDGWMFKNSTIGKKTGGRLRASIQGGAEGVFRHDPGKHELHFGTNVKYAGAILCIDDRSKGNPFTIRAKRAPFLVFPIGPKTVVRTKSVVHPGAKNITGKGSDKPLFERVAGTIESNAEKYIKNVAAKLPLFK